MFRRNRRFSHEINFHGICLCVWPAHLRCFVISWIFFLQASRPILGTGHPARSQSTTARSALSSVKKMDIYIFDTVWIQQCVNGPQKRKVNKGIFCMYFIQPCFIRRPSDSTVSEDARIESRVVTTLTLVVRRSNYSVRQTRLDLKRKI
jgi:hypothetical protein